ncbi:MAG: DUF4175 family protein [Candidatus Firestonebacteria bacterium]
MNKDFNDIAVLIGKTKSKYYAYLFIEALNKLVMLVLTYFFAFFFLDTVFNFSLFSRGAALAGFYLFLGVGLSYFTVKIISGKITAEHICLLAQKNNPKLKDSLVNAWQFFERVEKGKISEVSFELTEAYIKGVAETILKEDILCAVSFRRLKKIFLSSVSILAVFLCLYNISPYPMRFALLRLFDPALDIISLQGGLKLQGLPEIGDLKVKVIYPPYTGMSVKIFEEGGNAEALKNSSVEISGVTNKPVAAAYLEGKEGGKKLRLPMNTNDPLRPSVRFTVRENMEYYVVLTDRSNMENEEKIKHKIVIVKDEKPKINMIFPNEEMSVLPQSTVNIIYEYTDDFGIKEVNLIIENKGLEEKRRLFKDNSNRKTGSGTSDLEIASCDVKLGGEMQIYLEAFDNDIIDGPKRGVSQKVRLFLPGLEDYLKEADPMALDQFLELERKVSEFDSRNEDFEKQLKKYAKENDPDLARMLGDLEMLQDNLSKIAEKLISSVTEVPPEALKQLSVNTLDMGKTAELMKKLQEALARGDKEEAMRLAKELSKELNSLSRALKNMMAQSGLGKTAKNMKNAGLMKNALEEMVKREKEIYTETASEASVDLEKLLREQEETANLIIKKQQEAVEAAGWAGKKLEKKQFVSNLAFPVKASENIMKEILEKFKKGIFYDASSDLTQVINNVNGLNKIFRQVENYLQQKSLEFEKLANKENELLKGENKDNINRVTFSASNMKKAGDIEKEILELLQKDRRKFSLSKTNESNSGGIKEKQDTNISELDKFKKELKKAAKEGFPLSMFDEDASKAGASMKNASNSLFEGDSFSALPEEQEVINRLESMKSKMENLMQGGDSGGGPMLLSSGGKRRGSRGSKGKFTRYHKLPDKKEYKPPKEFREDIMDSMKDEKPRKYKDDIEEYYRKLLQ